ncbi:MAG TPA: FAD:protein FMN transferase, partial [Pyrinomonadaceae bacterium]|nr:FAD:protein FMN transferase [Pyrinomonadaceae bacterium]
MDRKKHRPMMVAAAVFLLLAGSVFAKGSGWPRYEFSEPHMGTTFRLVFYAPDKRSAERAARKAFSRIARLDGIMSDYRQTSELMALCRQAGQGPIAVSPDLFRVIERAQKFSQQSGGAFDITAGPVIKLWRRARRTAQLPDEKRLAGAR